MPQAPRISVVIAAYRPGEGLDRVIESLDAQTLPQDEFETIIVDDGSPDDTFERLQRIAAERPNMQVHRIENSGWPSKPRNLATGMARGEWVLFMDHDDSLYPDALRRAAEYAAETRADVLSPKESKTSDAWWGMNATRDGNIPNAVAAGGIDKLLPMVPHKFYRRTFLAEHGIRFPEGRRQLWEDIYVNVEAWRHAKVVAVLADTPVYLWHSSATNNSKTYGPRTEEFWDRLDELFAFIDRTLDGPEHAEARRSALMHQWRGRVLTRLSRNLKQASAAEASMGLERALAIAQRYVPEEWDRLLGQHERARAALLRAGRVDLLRDLWSEDADTAPDVRATAVQWRDGRLHIELEARWTNKKGQPILLVRRGNRLVRDLPEHLLAALPEDVIDLTDTLDDVVLDVAVRDRTDHVSWPLAHEPRRVWEEVDGGVIPVLRTSVALDPATAAFDTPLADRVHDLVASYHWSGASRAGAVKYGRGAMPALLNGRQGVAYRTTKGALALDLGGSLRNVVADGGLKPGRLPGTVQALTVPLPRVQVFGSAELPGAVRLAALSGDRELVLPGSVHAGPDGARLTVAATSPVPNGDYRITFQAGESDSFLGGQRLATVKTGAVTLSPHGATAPAPPAPPSSIGALRKAVVRSGKALRARIGR